MIDLKAELIPMRMNLMHKEPVELEIELVNNSNKSQMISIDIYSGDRIGFDKGGRNTYVSKKIIEFKAGERIRDYYHLYPRVNVERGTETIRIELNEHFNNSFQYVQSKKVKELSLRVD
jgi:hypothetical protein